MGLPWEWCGPHLFNRALVEGMGCPEAGGGADNDTGRALIMLVRRVITHISKSTVTKAVFDEAQI